MQLEDKLQRHEENSDDVREQHETELRGKAKEIVNQAEEIEIYKRKIAEMQQRIKQAGQKQSSDNKQIEKSIRKRENDWNDQKLQMDRTLQKV